MKQGGFEIDDQQIKDPIEIESNRARFVQVRVGKKEFRRIVVE